MNTGAVVNVDQITSEDLIDSRELIDLRAQVSAWMEDEDRDLMEFEHEDAIAIVAAVDAFESAGVADWEYGETFVRDSYFVTYAQELAEDIGAINADAAWPNTCIDWERAARELRMDYTAVEVNGVTYWAR